MSYGGKPEDLANAGYIEHWEGEEMELQQSDKPLRLSILPDDKIQHVYPNFGREHVTDKRDQCWCGPKVEFIEGGAIIIHEVEQ